MKNGSAAEKYSIVSINSIVLPSFAQQFVDVWFGAHSVDTTSRQQHIKRQRQVMQLTATTSEAARITETVRFIFSQI